MTAVTSKPPAFPLKYLKEYDEENQRIAAQKKNNPRAH